MEKIEHDVQNFTRFERARAIGSRALQIAQGAPFMIKVSQKELEALRYNPIEIAKKEFEAGLIPISIKRRYPFQPQQTEADIALDNSLESIDDSEAEE
ncbi:DNA-directed RNA polymerase subunit K [Candidatus Woesearchaeota archaeon CG_4_10_14_0_8_um_filter_47_5]|nr:MAG: DNA-directed RNA polymerase subunit K [Candidatus Woesearchaeota archaeon CG_4_10_14_0_8_um_filter_47_5]